MNNDNLSGQQQAGEIIYNAADQTTSIKIGTATANQVTENYTYDSLTGLLTNQKVERGGLNLLDLSYDYNRNNSVGNLSGKTGHLTKIIDNLDDKKNREYKFDALGRLTEAKGGTNSRWTQTYSYDRYGNRTNVTATGTAADNSPIPVDGTPNLSYEATTNRITTSGYQYDAAGNLIRGLNKDSSGWLRYEYDTANRLQIVKEDNGTYLQAFQYGSTSARLMSHDYEVNQLTIFASIGVTTLSEYVEFVGTQPTWTKSYTYLGSNVLSTITPNGQGGESTNFNHPDQLGTRVITNQTAGTSYEQTTLPFGTALNAESTASQSRRFTSYERSQPTGLDYAVNRTYDSKQGRFTQVDPIDMEAVDFMDPQTLNLYAYCGNDPINHVDPDGLFFGKLFKAIGNFFKKLFTSKWFFLAVTVALTVITVGAGLGLWSLTGVVVKSVSIMGYTGVALTLSGATIQITALGWITLGLAATAAIPTLTSFSGILQSVVSFGFGSLVSSISAPGGIGGTPDWNSDTNSSGFLKPRRARRNNRRSGPGSWAFGWKPYRSPREIRPQRSRSENPEFAGLRDHQRGHAPWMTPSQYYESALTNIQNGHRVKYYHNSQTKWAYITQVMPGQYIFTSTNLSGTRIFTHYIISRDGGFVTANTLRGMGISPNGIPLRR